MVSSRETLHAIKRTRIAPTPSGFLHLGNVLSFALTAGLAARWNAKILLRIDDLDRKRVQKRYIQDIFDTLNFLEIPWHEGPASMREYEREYSQFHRMDLYNEALQQLMETDRVFACICSRSEVLRRNKDGGYPGSCRDRRTPYRAENVSWRLRSTPGELLQMKTLENGIINADLPVSMHEFIVRRKDGLPSYQLASLIDDLHFGVNLVVRGEDLWESTLAQLYLAKALEGGPFSDSVTPSGGSARLVRAGQGISGLSPGSFLQAAFHHHTLLKRTGEKKLSKSTGTSSTGALSVQHLRWQGKKPAEIYSLIGTLLQLKEPVQDWRSLAAVVIGD